MLMTRWNPFFRYPILSLSGLLILLIPVLWSLKEIQVRSDADALLESNPSQKATLEKVTSVFKDQVILVVDLECEDVFTEAGLSAVSRVGEALMEVSGVLDVKSLTHSFKPVRKGFSFDMVPLAARDETDPGSMEKLRDYCLGNPLIRNVMVSPDARHATLTLTCEGRFETLEAKRTLRAELSEALAPFEAEGLVFQMVGLPLVEEEVYTRILGDFIRFVPLVALFLLVTLWVAFRSFGFVSFMLLNQLLALGVIAGTLQFFGYPFTVFTLLLFPLWAGIHLTLLVHLGSACQRADRQGARDVVTQAVRHIFKSCGFATLTTLAGLLALGLAAIPQVREAGLVGAYGVAVVFLMTFGPGVAVLAMYYRRRASASVTDEKEGIPVGETGQQAMAWLKTLRRGRGIVWALALIVVAITVVQGSRIRTGVRPIEFLPTDSPSRAAGELFNQSYGGFNMFQLTVDSGKTNGVNQLAFLSYLEDIQRFAEAKPEVSGAYSYAQVLAMMNQIWEQEKPGSLALPSNPLLLGTFSLVLKTQKFPFFEALCDADYKTANVVIRSPDQRSDQYLAVIESVLDYADEKKPEGVTLRAEQGLHTLLEADQQLVASQMRSAGMALVVVFVLLVLLWRSVWLALVAILFNALPVSFVMAVAVWLDVPLNSITVMIGAVAFGIAIDDTVHLVTQWLEGRGEGLDAGEAMARAIQIKFRPILCTSLVLGGIFALLAATSFPPVQHFGGLSALAFGFALLAVFALIPLAVAGRVAMPVKQPAEAEKA